MILCLVKFSLDCGPDRQYFIIIIDWKTTQLTNENSRKK